MPRLYCYMPSPYTSLLRRMTLSALLLAGGMGIAWACYIAPPSQMRGLNQQLGAANDVLLARAANAGDRDHGADMAGQLEAEMAAPGKVAILSTER